MLHCMCPIQSRLPSPFISFSPLYLAPHLSSSGNHHTVVHAYEGIVCACDPFTCFSQPVVPLPYDSFQSVLCICESVLLVDFVSLDSTYKWNHVVIVFF